MASPDAAGWIALMGGYPWFRGEGRFPLPAYSEFMPPPRLGRSPYGEIDSALFSADDPFGWPVSEWEEAIELEPGLAHLAGRIVAAVAGLGRGEPEPLVAGHRGRNLADNPYWPPELAESAGRLGHERSVVLAPVALSRTQDDKGRVRWTLFGSSEQGPERAFWMSFSTAPGREIPASDAEVFFVRLFSAAYGETASGFSGLKASGFRILPSAPDPRFPYWTGEPLPSWTREFLIDEAASWDDVRYLLTFRPFIRLPAEARQHYLSGRLALLPAPASLVFWGQPKYVRLQQELPLAMQIPLLKLVPRREGPGGLRVPQTGWLHEPGRKNEAVEIHEDLLLNSYRRTSRFDRVGRHAEDALEDTFACKVARILFGTDSEDLDLYGKPMARNAQLWTADSRLLLDGPRATPERIAEAAEEIEQGGLFRYRFVFPAMRVGLHEVYWHRPLAAFLSEKSGRAELVPDAPTGVLTVYRADAPDPAAAEFLWPRILRREPYSAALRQFDHARDHYTKQTVLNVLSILDTFSWLGDKPLPREFARDLLRLAEDETLEKWLDSLPGRAVDRGEGERVREELERRLEPASPGSGAKVVVHLPVSKPKSLTFGLTATRKFEEAWWNDILTLSRGPYINKDNADFVPDPPDWARLTPPRRDLEPLGEYLLERHRRAVAEDAPEGAACGEIPFRWATDFHYPLFGGWADNQNGRTYERDLLVVIPGRNRAEAVVLADHYDTAYMEDLFDAKKGGIKARVASAGADDNHSATATLLQAAPVFLRLAREGRLERDLWLLHLTGEEFPADCLGARHFVRSLIEGTLGMRSGPADRSGLDLSGVRVKGVFVMDMIAHNRREPRDVFQISPGKSPASVRLARLAQSAVRDWNRGTEIWNLGPERRGCGRGQRTPDGTRIPEPALHPCLRGEVRTSDDPRSSLFNTDGQVFSDAGVPVVLFMEDYDINRSGYHDTRDTMDDIDLDYGAAVAAVAIEAAARAAEAPSLD
jgi:hypothetical protein